MEIPRTRRRTRVGFNMTPMIDVVFLLIIFFLVSSHLARTENNKKLKLPVAASAEQQRDRQVPRVTVNVTQSGEIFVSGQPTDKNTLVEILNQVREDKGDDLEVRIRISKLATYRSAAPVMLACTEASIWNVSFAAVREETN